MGLLYGILSKHGWVRDFSEIWWFFHLNHHNFLTYEPFVKKLQKKNSAYMVSSRYSESRSWTNLTAAYRFSPPHIYAVLASSGHRKSIFYKIRSIALMIYHIIFLDHRKIPRFYFRKIFFKILKIFQNLEKISKNDFWKFSLKILLKIEKNEKWFSKIKSWNFPMI